MQARRNGARVPIPAWALSSALAMGLAGSAATAQSPPAASSTAEARLPQVEVAPSEPRPELVFEALVQTGDYTPAGKFDGHDRGFLQILGGRFSGPEVRGTILPSNRDWPVYYPNGARTTSVEYQYRTDDGQILFVTVDGWRYARTLTGSLGEFERARPGGNLLRAFVKIRAPDESRYAWMNFQLFYAVGGTSIRTPDGPRSRIRVYRLD